MPRKKKLEPGAPIPFTHANKEPNVPEWWKVLRGEMGLEATMYLFGGDPKRINATMNMLNTKDTEDGKQRSAITTAFAHNAYLHLVANGEIDPTKLWHYREKKYCNEVTVKAFDIAFGGMAVYKMGDNNIWQVVVNQGA